MESMRGVIEEVNKQFQDPVSHFRTPHIRPHMLTSLKTAGQDNLCLRPSVRVLAAVRNRASDPRAHVVQHRHACARCERPPLPIERCANRLTSGEVLRADSFCRIGMPTLHGQVQDAAKVSGRDRRAVWRRLQCCVRALFQSPLTIYTDPSLQKDAPAHRRDPRCRQDQVVRILSHSPSNHC